ncbi:MAG: hypothetical protein KGL53_15275, partial [Elusimicrobia bacterium]|nr:hypothetical protein [Elusimicrobiota bacterium]
MRLARMLELPEADLGRRLRELEADPLFAKMLAAKVVVIAPVPQARLGLRGLAAGAAAPGPGLPAGFGPIELALIERVGRERFEACFLRDEVLSDAERAAQARVSEEEARMLRRLVDRLTLQEEFEAQVPAAAPAKACSVVAGVSL